MVNTILGMDTTDWVILCTLFLQATLYMKRDVIKLKLSQHDKENSTQKSNSHDIYQIMKKNNKNYLILYATQTGTAEEYAWKFAKELSARFSLNVMCVDIEEFGLKTLESLTNLPTNVIVSFFISTYGEGEFPDGALNFQKFLSEINRNGLSKLHFTLFGLGNSTYEFYNGASKKAITCLKDSQARIIGQHGFGDDGLGTTDEDYLAWKEVTIEALKKQLQLKENEQRFEPAFVMEQFSLIDDKVSLGEPSIQYLPCNNSPQNLPGTQLGSFNSNHPYLASVVNSSELFNSKTRSCVHTEFDISGSDLEYNTGDHLGVWPSNSNEKVEKFLYAFNLNSETIFGLKPLDSTVKIPFPTPTTIGAAVRHYMEIAGPISRQTFSALTQFAPNTKIKEKLSELATNRKRFSEEITSRFFDLADAVLFLSGGTIWKTVPWGFLVELMPHLQPRYYSISSSSLSEPKTIHITSVVESFTNPAREGKVVGVTTNLLKNIQVEKSKNIIKDLDIHFDLKGPRGLFSDYKLPIHVRQSNFRLPKDPQIPVIMVGSGTGLAPFRGFIRERVRLLETFKQVTLGKHLLFYGCRDLDDFLYNDEWHKYEEILGKSFIMTVAHSRLSPKKVYVQDKLLEFEGEIFSLLDKGGILYVCGDAKGMAQGVNAALVDIFARGRSASKNEAIELVRKLKAGGKYQEDVW